MVDWLLCYDSEMSKGSPSFKSFKEYRTSYQLALATIAEKVPGITDKVVVIGTGPVAAMHLGHRQSWDIDLSMKRPLHHPSTVIKGLKNGFGKGFTYHGDDDIGIYHGELTLNGIPPISVDLFPHAEQHRLATADFEHHKPLGGFTTLSLSGYGRVKAGTLMDRNDFKDIYDLAALNAHPSGSAIVERSLLRDCDKKGIRTALQMARGLDYAGSNLHAQIQGFKPVSEQAVDQLAERMQGVLDRKEKIDRARAEDRRFDSFDRDFSFA